jgi:quinol monooxygenase YgiN
MYTLIHSLAVRAHNLENAQVFLHEEVLPVLQQQAGFIDYVLLESTTEPNRLLSISFWDSMETAHRYAREEYPKFEAMLVPLLEGKAEAHEYAVNTSTLHDTLQ